MGKIISIANQKGGVGKTTTAVNLAASIAATHHRVLMIDLDPQGNATTGCGVDKLQATPSACDLLLGEAPPERCVRRLENLGFDLIPANRDLTAAEIGLLEQQPRERRLANLLEGLQGRYDYLLIDCPPALNMLTLNALVAADSILIPMQCEYYALEGLTDLMRTLGDIRQALNHRLRLEGVLRTMYDARSRLAKDVSDQLESHFGSGLFHTFIPRNVRLAEAPSHGLPVYHYDRGSSGALAYLALAGELLERNRHSVDSSAPFGGFGPS